MATELSKDVVRESTVIKNDRNINIAMTADQKVTLKLKGMKSGGVEISIEELWNHLNGIDGTLSSDDKGSLSIVKTEEVSRDDSPMISLYDLRSHLCTSLKHDVLSIVDPLINKFVSDHKEAIKVKNSKPRKKE